MASAIDPTVFPDNVPVDKSDMRQQFQIAHDEITQLQLSTSVQRTSMRDDNNWNSV